VSAVPHAAREPKADPAVRREWLRRVEAEYRSAALTSSLSHWLIQLSAPVKLIELALDIVADELAHAELSHRVYQAADGRKQLRLTRETLGLPRSPLPLEHDVLLHGVEVFCLGETIAVRLFSRMRAGCDVDSARTALDRILRDEVRHRDFGWTLLEWLLTLPASAELRARLERELPAMLGRVRKHYVRDLPDHSFDPERRRWGLIPLDEYAEVYAQTLAKDYRPLLADLEFAIPDDD